MRTLSHSSEMRFVIQGCCSFFKKKREEEEKKKKSSATFEIYFLFAELCSVLLISCYPLYQSLSRCQVNVFSRTLRIWRQKLIWGLTQKWTKRTVSSICWYGRQAGGREGRLDGDFTDTNNFLTQRYCNSSGENSSPFHPMNQHDPISA